MDQMIKLGEKFPASENSGAGFEWKRYDGRREEPRKNRVQIRLDWRMKSAIAYALVFAMIISSACYITKVRTTKKLRAEFDIELKAAVFNAEQSLASRMRDEYGLTAEEELMAQIDEEAKIMAKAAYFARENTDRGIFSVCVAIANRYLDKCYPDTIYGVCSQPGNIQGWSDDNPIVKHIYDIAKVVLIAMHDGVHIIDPGYVYINWSPKEVVLQDSIEKSGKVHKFYEDDWDGIIEQYLG